MRTSKRDSDTSLATMNKNYKFKCDKCKCIAGLSPVVEPNVTFRKEKFFGKKNTFRKKIDLLSCRATTHQLLPTPLPRLPFAMLVATTFAAAFAREVFFCHDCWYSFWHVDGVCTKNCTTDRISQKTWQQRLHGIWCSLFQSVILVAFLRKRIFAIYGTCTSSRLFVPRLACLLNNLVGPVERKPA